MLFLGLLSPLTLVVPAFSAIGDSVDDWTVINFGGQQKHGDGSFEKYEEWVKKISGEEGNITAGTLRANTVYKDSRYYVPKDFSWLSDSLKEYKSLISYIGISINQINGIIPSGVGKTTFSNLRVGNGTSSLLGDRTTKISYQRAPMLTTNSGTDAKYLKAACVLEPSHNRKATGFRMYFGLRDVLKANAGGGGRGYSYDSGKDNKDNGLKEISEEDCKKFQEEVKDGFGLYHSTPKGDKDTTKK